MVAGGGWMVNPVRLEHIRRGQREKIKEQIHKSILKTKMFRHIFHKIGLVENV